MMRAEDANALRQYQISSCALFKSDEQKSTLGAVQWQGVEGLCSGSDQRTYQVEQAYARPLHLRVHTGRPPGAQSHYFALIIPGCSWLVMVRFLMCP